MEASLHRLRKSGTEAADEAPPAISDRREDLMHRTMSSIRRIRQERVDQDLLHRTIEDSGKFAYGTKMVEVWVWDPDMSKLCRPEGGWWIDPYWHDEGHAKDGTCTFCQLVDATRHDYIAPPTLSPGVGIPGVLWADLGRATKKRRHRRSEGNNTSGPIDPNMLLNLFSQSSINDAIMETVAPKSVDRIAWRDIQALSADPYQPQNHRLQVIASTDLRWTSGVPFQANGEEGIVVYYARDTVNLTKLRDKTNTDYLMHSADFIGSAWSLRVPRQIALQRRQEENSRNFRKVKDALVFLSREGINLADIATTPTKKRRPTRFSSILPPQFNEANDKCGTVVLQIAKTSARKVKRKTRQFIVKLRGGGTVAPPVSGWKQSIFTTIGVLLSVLSLGAVNDQINSSWGSEYSMPLAPFGALLGLQFGLTAAPTAQPKSILVGQVVSILVALGFAQITSFEEQPWIKQSLACAVAVGCMAKIGIVNPPAAANAFVFASGTLGFGNMLGALLGSLLAIALSTCINNVSNLRQYPSYWGIPKILQCSFPGSFSKTAEVRETSPRGRKKKREISPKNSKAYTKASSKDVDNTTRTSNLTSSILPASKIQDAGDSLAQAEAGVDQRAKSVRFQSNNLEDPSPTNSMDEDESMAWKSGRFVASSSVPNNAFTVMPYSCAL